MEFLTINAAQWILLGIALTVFLIARPVAADGIVKTKRTPGNQNLWVLAAVMPLSIFLLIYLARHPEMMETAAPLVLSVCVAAGFFRGMLRLPWEIALAASVIAFVIMGSVLGAEERSALLVPLAALGGAGLVWYLAGARGAVLSICLLWVIDLVLFFTGTLESLQFAAMTGDVTLNSLSAVQIGDSGLGGGDLFCAALLGAWTIGRLQDGGRLLAGATMTCGLALMVIASNTYALAVPATCPMLAALIFCWGLQTRPMEKQVPDAA